MADVTEIPWCDHTFNPWIGCCKCSEGCMNCYAVTETPVRVSRSKGLELWGPDAARRVNSEALWKRPAVWDQHAARAGERRRVFSASLADLFEDYDGQMVDAEGRPLWLDPDTKAWLPERRSSFVPLRMMNVLERLRWVAFRTPHLDWLWLTKRPERMAEFFRSHRVPNNVWAGTTAENQARWDERIPHLLRVDPENQRRIRFVSAEPLLGPIDPRSIDTDEVAPNSYDSRLKPLRGRKTSLQYGFTVDCPRIDWIICGAESGPKARTFDLQWARDLRDHCREAGTAFFMKQVGQVPLDSSRMIEIDTDKYVPLPIPQKDRKGGDPAEWPEDLRIREFPAPRTIEGSTYAAP